jgi:hypothetical protein
VGCGVRGYGLGVLVAPADAVEAASVARMKDAGVGNDSRIATSSLPLAFSEKNAH